MHRAFTFTSYEWKHYIEERIDVNRVLGNKNKALSIMHPFDITPIHVTETRSL